MNFIIFLECQKYIIRHDKMQRMILMMLNSSSSTMKPILYGDDGSSVDTNKNIYLLLFVNISKPQSGSTLPTSSLTKTNVQDCDVNPLAKF